MVEAIRWHLTGRGDETVCGVRYAPLHARRLQTVDCKRCLAMVARPVTRDAQVLQPEQLSPRRIG